MGVSFGAERNAGSVTVPDKKTSKYVKEAKSSKKDDKANKTKLDLNTFYNEYHSKYNKSNKAEYYSDISSEILNSITKEYGISKESDNYSEKLEKIYSQIVTDNNLVVDGKKLGADATIEEVNLALAKYSWDGKSANDTIILPEAVDDSLDAGLSSYELDLNEYYNERKEYTKGNSADSEYLENAGNAIINTISDCYGINLKDKNGSYTSEIRNVYSSIAESNPELFKNYSFDFNNDDDINSMSKVLAGLSWDHNSSNDIIKLPNVSDITQDIQEIEPVLEDIIEVTPTNNTDKISEPINATDKTYESLKSVLVAEGLSEDKIDLMKKGYNSQKLLDCINQLKNKSEFQSETKLESILEADELPDVVSIVDESTHMLYRINMNTYEFLGKYSVSTGHTDLKHTKSINKSGSQSTAPGWYIVGSSYKRDDNGKKWNQGIRMHGIESCNDQTFTRGAVGHIATYPSTGRTWGCFGFNKNENEPRLTRDYLNNPDGDYEPNTDKFFEGIRNEILAQGDLVFVCKEGTDYLANSDVYKA